MAEDTYERHNTFCRLLTGLGVDEKTTAADACEMEHAVSRERYETLKMLAEKQKGKREVRYYDDSNSELGG
ncbi:iron dependent repressor, metal binding and dimerization domain protein [Treponema sp.]|uniref:iron dependent repressor, metal binding and dimerization domain protein n=1 Tax=Treponema sp. TaxID=166 RepID=UPI003FD6D7B8